MLARLPSPGKHIRTPFAPDLLFDPSLIWVLGRRAMSFGDASRRNRKRDSHPDIPIIVYETRYSAWLDIPIYLILKYVQTFASWFGTC